jgi:hypothetical protein
MVSVTPTDPGTPLSRKDKIALLKSRHEKGMARKGITNFLFSPKMKYIYKERAVVTLFPSECESGEDLYLEFVNKDYDSEDPTHTLYRIPYNPHFKEEYETRAISTGTGYIVPVSMLEEVLLPMDDAESEGASYNFQIPNPDEFTNISLMTVEDYAAIHLGLPISGRKWLDDAIRKKYNLK